jgi:hypothetical protein
VKGQVGSGIGIPEPLSCGSPGFPAFGGEKSPAKRDLDDNSCTNKRVFQQPLKRDTPCIGNRLYYGAVRILIIFVAFFSPFSYFNIEILK